MKRFFLSILTICLIAIFLISCGTDQYEEGYEAGFQQGYYNGWQEGFQAGKGEVSTAVTSETIEESKYTAEEICARIWTKLPYELPEEYNIEQFKLETRIAEYVGNRKWSFEVYGSGEDRITAPNVTEEKSDVLWIERIQEEVITYDLKLRADFFENGSILEITKIDELNRQSSLETVSETTLRAELLVKWYRFVRDGWDYHLEGSVINIGPIPLDSVLAKIEWKESDSGQTVITHEIPVYTRKIDGEQYAGFLPPDNAAHFKIAFKDKRLLSIGELVFLTPSGEVILHEVDVEFLKKQAGL